MGPLWFLALVHLTPLTVTIATARGMTPVPVSMESGDPAVAAPLLVDPLGVTIAMEETRATVLLAGTEFVFNLGVPYARAGSVVCPFVGDPYMARDTLFLPLEWLSECIPRVLAARFRWDPVTSKLEERIVSFDALSREALSGCDVAMCALGTTIP